jgi:iron complex outermembrane receptor protein
MKSLSGYAHGLLLTGVCASTVLYASASFAEADADASSLQEIVVTAQKRTENIRDVPISITALSASDLEQAGIKSTQDLVDSVPGLHMDRVGDTTLPSIRGITTYPTTAGIESNVALYVDNIYVPDAAVATMDLPDVSRVDVLKGPQGTLFGRNATGGAIQIFTLDPQMTSFGGNVSASYGNYNDEVVKGFVTGPIIPGLVGFSLSGYQETADSYYHSLTPDVPIPKVNDYTVRGKLLFTPTDDTRVLLTGLISQHADPAAMLYEPLDGITAAKGFPGAIIPTRPWQTASNVPLPDKTTNDIVSAQVNQKTALGDITVLGAWSESQLLDNTTTGTGAAYPAPLMGTNYFSHTKVTSYQAEVDFASRKFGDFSFVTGANYYNSRNVWNPDSASSDLPGGGFALAIFGGQTTSSYAFFGEGTYQFTDALSLIAGLRYSDDDRSVIGNFVYGSIPTSSSYPTWESHNWGSVTQRVSLNYKITPDTNAYFTYSTGFQSGNFDNTTIPINTTPAQCAAANAAKPGSCALPNLVQPEKVTAFEIGIKSTPTPWLRIDAALYDQSLTNMQISVFQNVCNTAPCPPNPTVPEGELSNAAATSMFGAELNVEAQATHELRFHGGISLLDATFSKYEGASWDVPAPGGVGLVSTPAQSADGKQVPRSPKATLDLGATYTKDLPVGQFAFTANGYASERVYYDVGNVFYQPAYATLGLRASFSPVNIPNLNVALWGNNVTNKPVILGNFINSGGALFSYQPPATYGITFAYKFGQP